MNQIIKSRPDLWHEANLLGRNTKETQHNMVITISFNAYNPRRYSRPWIAKVIAWPVGGRAELTWGTYLGNERGGDCEIAAEPGDVIRSGKKDLRKTSGSSADWAIVQPDGTLLVCDERTAAKAFRAKVEGASA